MLTFFRFILCFFLTPPTLFTMHSRTTLDPAGVHVFLTAPTYIPTLCVAFFHNAASHLDFLLSSQGGWCIHIIMD